MKDLTILKRPVTSRPKIKEGNSTPIKNKRTPSIDLKDEVDENFMNYLSWHGLANEDKLLILSSKLHYYYDYDELREVTTLISLKKLNLVKHLDDFLQSVYGGLSPKANFIGCFADRKSEKSITARYYKRFINFLDARIDTEIDGRDISRLFESHGFKVVDMTEINGLTYFRTQNLNRTTA
jgi:hypothetical protein